MRLNHWLSIGLMLIGSATAGGIEPPGADVDRWLRRLGSRSWRVRDRATRLLLAGQLRGDSSLRQGLKVGDLEVRRRCRAILLSRLSRTAAHLALQAEIRSLEHWLRSGRLG